MMLIGQTPNLPQGHHLSVGSLCSAMQGSFRLPDRVDLFRNQGPRAGGVAFLFVKLFPIYQSSAIQGSIYFMDRGRFGGHHISLYVENMKS